jgi:hypothetical protein
MKESEISSGLPSRQGEPRDFVKVVKMSAGSVDQTYWSVVMVSL